MKILHISHKLVYFVQNTKISNGEVLSDSVTLKTELNRFGQRIKILHILH